MKLRILNQINSTINLQNIYEENFLTYIQITNKHINKSIVYLLKKFLNEIYNLIVDENPKIFFNINDVTINFLQKFYFTKIDENNKIEIITNKNNIIGLEEEIVNNMLFAYEYYRKNVSSHRYSAKTYYDQKFDDYSIKNNILILLGIISTGFVSKLGNG
jgi:hypothetical protein